jgi:mannose-6-phosphate isomerase-like protein (cupin superfamily)
MEAEWAERTILRGMSPIGERSHFDVRGVQEHLAAGNGGYEIVYESPWLEVGVYVLVAPEPDRQEPHEWDEVYIVLEGRGVLAVEGEPVELEQGQAMFVPAGAEHRFSGYDRLSMLVLFEKRPTGKGE